MIKRLPLLILALIILGCGSVKKHNRQAAALRTVSQLRKDVDFAYKKLKQLHPNLYWYISKDQLDHKFDSLKTTITEPMNSYAFYKKISPVVASVRQGHMTVIPLTKALDKKESKALTAKGTGPFSQFDFDYVDDRLYVIKNKSYDSTIVAGTEVVAINNVSTSDLFKGYSRLFTSDGFNQTFKKIKLAAILPKYYTAEHGYMDTIDYSFRISDSIKTIRIARKVIDTTKIPVAANKKKKKLTKEEKAKLKSENAKKSLYGYNPETKLNNRELKFLEADSTIALLKIRGFSIGNSAGFYRQAFKKIKDNNAKTLIIDLRNNPGGRLVEISDLYRYLADSTFVFVDKSQVTSKTSLFHADYFKGGSFGLKAIKTLVAPLYYGYNFFNVRRAADGKYYSSSRESKPQQLYKNAFKGKIYVLINGGSFSASCILSSNLKGSGRAYFVGQETGGTYNGTVAGRMPVVKLPYSKVGIRIGLMYIAPHYKNKEDGRGIFPDQQIIPTLADRLNNKDPEMDWILDDIKSKTTELTESTE